MTGDTYLPFWQNETCGGLFSERPPQVVKLQQHSAPGPYMGIPGKGARNHTAGIQTPPAINKAKCRVIVVAAFCSLSTPINGHRLTFRKTREGDLERLACGGARSGQMEVPWRAGGRVKIKEFHRPASSRLGSARATPRIPTARPFSHFTQHWDSKSRLQTWARQDAFRNKHGHKPQTNNCLKTDVETINWLDAA